MPMAIVPSWTAREVPVHQIADDATLAGLEDFAGNLGAGRKRRARQRLPSLAAGRLELEVARGFASMMKPRSALVTSSAESITSVRTSSSTRPEPSARRPLRMAAIWPRSVTSDERLRAEPDASIVAEREHQFDGVGATQPDPIPVLQGALRHLLAVDERAVARAAVAQDVAAAIDRESRRDRATRRC